MRDIVRLLTMDIFVNVLIEIEGLLEAYFWIAAMETALRGELSVVLHSILFNSLMLICDVDSR